MCKDKTNIFCNWIGSSPCGVQMRKNQNVLIKSAIAMKWCLFTNGLLYFLSLSAVGILGIAEEDCSEQANGRFP